MLGSYPSYVAAVVNFPLDLTRVRIEDSWRSEVFEGRCKKSNIFPTSIAMDHIYEFHSHWFNYIISLRKITLNLVYNNNLILVTLLIILIHTFFFIFLIPSILCLIQYLIFHFSVRTLSVTFITALPFTYLWHQLSARPFIKNPKARILPELPQSHTAVDGMLWKSIYCKTLFDVYTSSTHKLFPFVSLFSPSITLSFFFSFLIIFWLMSVRTSFPGSPSVFQTSVYTLIWFLFPRSFFFLVISILFDITTLSLYDFSSAFAGIFLVVYFSCKFFFFFNISRFVLSRFLSVFLLSIFPSFSLCFISFLQCIILLRHPAYFLEFPYHFHILLVIKKKTHNHKHTISEL